MPVYPSGGTIAQSVGSPGFGPAPTPSYNASASVRLNPADSAYFSYVPTLQGSRTTWTWSGWVKRSVLGNTYQELFGTPNGASNTTFCVLTFGSNGVADTLGFQVWTTVYRVTTQVFRDPAQWYHILCAVDTTQSTGANRVKLYVNGTQITAFSTSNDPAQFAQLPINAAGAIHTIGRDLSQSVNFGGYLADVNFVDGLALTPSSFTATDANTGQLVPAQYTGAFGRNGFYLPLSGAALAVDLGQNPKTTGQDFPYWPMSTLLVNTTSTNGAQNNTFLDSSTNNFTITRNGNTTQGNFTPFNYGGGTTQANGYYSGYFDGTGDYLNFNGTTLNVGTGSFTLEGWVYITSYTFSSVISTWNSLTAPVGFILGLDSSGRPFFSIGTASGAGSSDVLGANAIPLNVWTHLAATKTAGSGGTMTLYVNGVSVGTNTTTRSVANTAAVIGRYYQDTNNYYLNGYISNVRVVTNSVVYASNFTVPTTPLTAISGTQVLTCQSSQFIDNSANAFAITANGNSQPVTTNPFGMTAWSGYFDGTGDYLTFPELNIPASTSFTIEFFVSWNAVPSTLSMFISEDGGSASKYLTYNNNGTLQAQMGGSAATVASCPFTLSSNVWYHIAFVRNVNTVTIYVNGVAQTMTQATQSGAFLDVGTINYIGRWGGSPEYAFNGQMSNFRAVVGTAVYTSNFTPPTSPLTAITNTQLLTCQSSTFIDNSPSARAITVFGNAYTGTLNNPFNSPINYTTPPVQGWSNYFEGTSASVGGGLTFPSSSNFAMGTGDFTVEGWYFPNRAADAATPMSIAWYIGTINGANAAGGGVATDQIHYRAGGSSNQITLVTNVTGWNHVAWVRQSGVIYVYLNGIVVASAANTTSISAGTMIVSRPGTDTFRFSGWISNMRVVKGRAVYNANFTPSNTPLGYVDGTVLLTCQSNNFADNSLFRAVPTVNTPANISPSSPFIPTQAWSAASYGGAMYFDGSDYLTAPHDASLSPTGNFTIEFWAYNTGSTAVQEWVTKGFGIQIYSFNSLWYAAFSSNNTSTYFVNASFGTSLFNTWQHIAVTRSGNTYTGFVNGVATSLGTSASAPGTGTSLFAAGVSTLGTPYYVTGYMSGLRVINGTALYTTSFAPPVLPPTAVTNTALLLNATNSGIYDAAGENVIETVGNAQVSTAVKKWGESSMYFDGSGDYLLIPSTNAPTQFGSQDFTIEMWIYSTSIGNQQMIFSNRVASTGNTHFDWQIFTSKLYWGTTSTNICVGVTTLSSNTWYHVAVSRVSGTTRQFINGVLDVSSTTSYTLSGNAITNIGTNGTHAPTQYPFVGYIQDVRVSKGVGRYSGNFTPPAAAFAYNRYDICNQQWTPNNISVTAGVGQDNLVDSPSDYGTDTGLGGQVRGNYATFNPLLGTGTLSNGNLQYAGIVGDATRPATIGVSSGKWYAEFNVNSALGATVTMGIAVYDQTAAGTSNASQSRGYFYTGQKYSNGSLAAYGNSFTNGDVIGVALDLDAGKVWFSKNGVFQASGDPVAGTNAAYTDLGTTSTWFVSIQSGGSAGTSASAFLNAGQRAFAYTAPTGFKCLVSTNLPTPTIGTTSSTRADKYFNVVLYTGDGVSGRTVTGVGFQPDLVWVKARNQAYSNQVTDAVRGPSKSLITNSSTAQETNRSVGYVSAFASDGFTLTTGATNINEVNQNGTTYVSWNWNAGGTNTTNTNGSITSTVRVNTTSGASIVTFTGSGAGATVGHGLGATPGLIIVKRLDATGAWTVWHNSFSAVQYAYLDTAGAVSSAGGSTVWNSTLPTSTVFNVGTYVDVNASGSPIVAYCFREIPGYSKIGTYTGNGSADGAFVYTGFRPEFIFSKSFAVEDWYNWDSARDTYNASGLYLFPRQAAAEQNNIATYPFDILSNGFKIRNSAIANANGVVFLYMAVAQFPFKYSRAR